MKYTVYEQKAHILEITPLILRDLLIKFFASRVFLSPYDEEKLIKELLRINTEEKVNDYLNNIDLEEWDKNDLVTIYKFIKVFDDTINITKARQ